MKDGGSLELEEEMQRINKYEVDMSKGPLLKKILVYALPVVLTGMLQLLYNAADIVVVGRYAGSMSVAAVGSTTSLVNLIVNLFMNLSIGVSVAVAQSYGAKDFTALSETVHSAYLLSLIVGALVGTFGFFASRTILELMGSPPDVLELSALYLRIFFLSMPATTVYNFGAAILRAVGNTRQPLYYLSVAGIINVVLNLFFVIRFKMGVEGVAFATVIAQYVSAALITLCLIRTEGAIRLNLKRLRLYGSRVWKIVRIGLPAGLQSTVFSISNVIIQSSINSFGSVAMAGSAASSNIEGFIYTGMNGIAQASLTFTGQNVGAKQYRRIGEVVRICMATVVLMGIGFGIIGIAFSGPLLRIYLPIDAQAVVYGAERLFIMCASYFLMGAIDVLICSMRGMGSSLAPMLVVLAGACGLRIVWVYTAFAARRTLAMLYLAYPGSWLVTLIIEMGLFYFVYKRVKERSPIAA